jgi:hypothetical protein
VRSNTSPRASNSSLKCAPGHVAPSARWLAYQCALVRPSRRQCSSARGSACKKSWESRRMAAYAGLVDRVDQELGRLFADLEKTAELDSTIASFSRTTAPVHTTGARSDVTGNPTIPTRHGATAPAGHGPETRPSGSTSRTIARGALPRWSVSETATDPRRNAQWTDYSAVEGSTARHVAARREKRLEQKGEKSHRRNTDEP